MGVKCQLHPSDAHHRSFMVIFGTQRVHNFLHSSCPYTTQQNVRSRAMSVSLTAMSCLKGTQGASEWSTRASMVDVLGRPCCVSTSVLPMSAALDYISTCPATLHVVRQPTAAGSEFPLQTQKSKHTAHTDLCPCFRLPWPIRTVGTMM